MRRNTRKGGLIMNVENMNLQDIEVRLSELNIEVRDATDIKTVEALGVEKVDLLEKRRELEKLEMRKAGAEAITKGTAEYKILETRGMNMDIKQENNIDLEVRALQKYLTSGTRNLSEVEERALNLAGSAAVLPTDIYNKLITSTKYSDLLNKATIIDQGGAGKIYIPIASNNAATWKTELAEGNEASATLTKLELGGFELMRLLNLSGATSAMTVGNFENVMLELLASEVIETLEKSFISGVGTTQPLGLSQLSWTTDTNEILTASAATPIAAADIAEGLSLLPQKYARNAVVIVNSDMLYNIQMVKGTNEYAFNLAEGATKFLGKSIIVSEHVSDNEVYIVDPKELYVRFAAPLAIEADRSAGFTSASIYLRSLTVVDAVWNPAAAVRIGLGA